MNLSDYLHRIGYDGAHDANANTLRRLHRAHLFHVPFENLSIHLKRPIVLDTAHLFEKIVRQRRGGFCYELNGLLAWALGQMGFAVTMLSAGVMSADGNFGPNFDHMALLVQLDERWLVDVGFGDSFLEPLRLDERSEQQQDNGAFRLDEEGDDLTLMRQVDDQWQPQYRFTLTPRIFSDYAEMCHFHQTSPQSHFTRKRVCTRATPQGRLTLSDLRLITTTGDERDERQLADEAEFDAMLIAHFGIALAQTTL